MAEATAPQLNPQELIARHRVSYFFMQMRVLMIGTVVIVVAAQFFLDRQFIAMVCAAIAFDLYRPIHATVLHRQIHGRWYDEHLAALYEYYWASTPRRWLEYVLLALPANALLTYALHSSDFDTLNNAATLTMAFIQDALGAVRQETSELRAGAMSFAVDFGFTGVLEYLAVRWLFAKRRLKIQKKS